MEETRRQVLKRLNRHDGRRVAVNLNYLRQRAFSRRKETLSHDAVRIGVKDLLQQQHNGCVVFFIFSYPVILHG